MRILLLNGSPRQDGNTSIALQEVADTLHKEVEGLVGYVDKEGKLTEDPLHKEGIETITVQIGTQPMRGCIGCGGCVEKGRCVFSDDVYDKIRAILEKGIDGIVIGSPVYYGGPNGSLCALLDRLFYSCGALLAYKPAAAVVVCRRGGASATFDRLNKYFTINNMPVVPSQYWNSVHGAAKGEARQDLEGLQTMRTLARNMIWMLRGMDSRHRPQPEPRQRTSFIR